MLRFNLKLSTASRSKCLLLAAADADDDIVRFDVVQQL
jgi:hypothetical protein